jgi:hypothetical protein
MARSVLASELIQRGREAADRMNDTNVTDTWLYQQATALVARLWDILTMKGLGGEGIKTVYLSTVANQQDYLLSGAIWKPTPAGVGAALADFYKVKTLYCNDGNGLYRPVSRVSPSEEYGLKAPGSVFSLKLCYLPCAPVFTTGAESFDGINGYEEWIVQGIAYAIKTKQNDDGGPHKGLQREIEQQIETAANRNMDEPPRIIQRRAGRAWASKILPWSGGVGGWDLRGSNIELYAPSYGLFF